MNKQTVLKVSNGLLCAIMAATFAAIWVPTVQEDDRLGDEKKAALAQTLPKLNETVIITRASELLAELAEPVSQDHHRYLKLLDNAGQLGLAIWRHRLESSDKGRELDAQIDFRGLQDGLESAHRRYSQRFPNQPSIAETQARVIHGVWHAVMMDMKSPPVSRAPLLPLMTTGYLQTILLAFIFFSWRLKREGFKVLVETWRLPVACAGWPAAVFCYPRWINPRKQYERAKQFVIYAFSLLTSIVGVATTSYAQQQGGSVRPKTEQVDNPDPSVTWSAQLLSRKLVMNGKVPYDGPVVQSDVTVSWKNGLYFNLWGQSNLDGHSNAGREVDATVGWNNRHLKLGLTYFDLNPPLDASRADVLRPFLEAPWPIKIGERHTLTPYLRLEYLHATRQSETNSGTFSIVGLRHAWNATSTITLDHVGWLLYDSSVFRSDTGVMGRYELRVRWKVGEKLTIDPLLFKLSVPLSSIDDRGVETMVGAGMSVVLH